jgi:hypothetical protein
MFIVIFAWTGAVGAGENVTGIDIGGLYGAPRRVSRSRCRWGAGGLRSTPPVAVPVSRRPRSWAGNGDPHPRP